MNCHRCKGLLIPTWLNEAQADGPIVEAVKCVCCGYVEDKVMRERRILKQYEEGVKA